MNHATRTACLLLAAGMLLLVACMPAETEAPPAPAPLPSQTPAPATSTAPAASSPTAAVAASAIPTAPPAPARFGAGARRHMEVLSVEIGARLPGSPEEARAAAYIEKVLRECGYAPEVQEFSFFTEDGEELESANVVAVRPGASLREIIVGAHYDSGDEAQGADDNASGAAALLETACLLQSSQPHHTIRLVAFGAEEEDLDGSAAYVEGMDAGDIRNTAGMINLDSLAAGDIAYVYGDAGAGSLRDWILERAAQKGFELEGRTARELDGEDGAPCDCADYDAFQEAGIPFAYFEATNWDLGEDAMTQVDPRYGDGGEIRHTRYDTLEYLDATFPGRVDERLHVFISLLFDVLLEFQAAG